jgi:hypothetical protein
MSGVVVGLEKERETGNPKKKQKKGDTNAHHHRRVSESSCLRLTASLQPRSVMCVVRGVVW